MLEEETVKDSEMEDYGGAGANNSFILRTKMHSPSLFCVAKISFVAL